MIFFVSFCPFVNLHEITSHQNLPSHRTCKHHYPTIDDIPHPVKIQDENDSRVKRDVQEGPLRIKVFYHKSVDDLKPKERRLIQKEVRIIHNSMLHKF